MVKPQALALLIYSVSSVAFAQAQLPNATAAIKDGVRLNAILQDSTTASPPCPAMDQPQAYVPIHFTPEQRLRADRLVSVYENSTLDFQYDYSENIHDGCGYTTGRAGFCTSQGDLLDVIERYTAKQPNNPLKKYIPRLRKLANPPSESTVGLDGFQAAVKLAGKDKAFHDAQDEVVGELQFDPAQKLADEMHLKLPLSLAILYQTGYPRGFGDDPSSVTTMAKQAKDIIMKRDGVWDEKKWLDEFLIVYRDATANSSIEAVRGSVGRPKSLIEYIKKSQNYDFSGPVVLNPYGDDHFTIP